MAETLLLFLLINFVNFYLDMPIEKVFGTHLTERKKDMHFSNLTCLTTIAFYTTGKRSKCLEVRLSDYQSTSALI